MLVPNLIVINYPKPTTGANALTGGMRGQTKREVVALREGRWKPRR
jgi:hypothetical protein